MGMVIDKERVTFTEVVYEDEVVALRDHLQACVPEPVVFDLTECQDLHLAVLQQVLAYQRLYRCEHLFGDERYIYQSLIEGFDTLEDDCSQ